MGLINKIVAEYNNFETSIDVVKDLLIIRSMEKRDEKL